MSNEHIHVSPLRARERTFLTPQKTPLCPSLGTDPAEVAIVCVLCVAVVLLMLVLTSATTGCLVTIKKAPISLAPSLLLLLYVPITLVFKFLELTEISLAPGPLHMTVYLPGALLLHTWPI